MLIVILNSPYNNNDLPINLSKYQSKGEVKRIDIKIKKLNQEMKTTDTFSNIVIELTNQNIDQGQKTNSRTSNSFISTKGKNNNATKHQMY